MLCYCMEFANSVLRIFMTMFMRDIVLPVVFSFFCSVFGFGVRIILSS